MDRKSSKGAVLRRRVSVLDRTSNRYVSARDWNVKGSGLKYKQPHKRQALLERWSSLQVGDHLVTRRGPPLPVIGYTHHGLYIGNGKVIHYAGWHRMFKAGPVCLTWLDDFAGGRDIVVESEGEYERDCDGIARQYAVRRALKRLGESKYRVLTQNCEHFVNQCISKKSRSRQVENANRGVHRVGNAAVARVIVGKGIKLWKFAKLPTVGGAALLAIGSFL